MQKLPMPRQAAYQMVVEKIGINNLSVEAGMRQLAEHLGEDIEFWGLTGLLHDLDYNETKDDEARHTYLTAEWLTQHAPPQEMMHAIHAHPGHVSCESRLDWSLYCVDPATGFLVACALMHPDKKLASLDSDFMIRRFHEKRFAAGALRENMQACSHLGLELPDFLLIVRDGMQKISGILGL